MPIVDSADFMREDERATQQPSKHKKNSPRKKILEYEWVLPLKSESP